MVMGDILTYSKNKNFRQRNKKPSSTVNISYRKSKVYKISLVKLKFLTKIRAFGYSVFNGTESGA